MDYTDGKTGRWDKHGGKGKMLYGEQGKSEKQGGPGG